MKILTLIVFALFLVPVGGLSQTPSEDVPKSLEELKDAAKEGADKAADAVKAAADKALSVSNNLDESCVTPVKLDRENVKLIRTGLTEDEIVGTLGSEGCGRKEVGKISGGSTAIKVYSLKFIDRDGRGLKLLFANKLLIDMDRFQTRIIEETSDVVTDEEKVDADYLGSETSYSLSSEESGVMDKGKSLVISEDEKGMMDKVRDVAISDDEPSEQNNIDLSMYKQITMGMTLDLVEQILTRPGAQTRSSNSGNSVYVSYKWEGPDYQRVYVNFRNGQVTSKSQTNLGKNGDVLVDIDKDKYEQIKNGMSVYEVQVIIGSNGEETSSSNIGSSSYKSYRWKGEKFSSITVRFKDDKVTGKSQYGLK